MAGAAPHGVVATLNGLTMGTSWSARLVSPPDDAAAVIQAVLDRVIDQMSNWESGSVISRFNRLPPGLWMTLPPDMMTVLQAGVDMARLTHGAFDPAIGTMVGRWGFGPASGSVPDIPSVSAPWQAIDIDGDRARRLAPVALDFSGIAKGFAVDAVMDALQQQGVDHGLVEIGGELRAIGLKPGLEPWWVDAEAPTGLPVPTVRVALVDMGMATSGDYHRYRMDEGGRRLSHSIDPRTGRPIDEGVASVTVLHHQTMMADAWATAITIMGKDAGMRLATQHGLAARLVQRTADGAMEYVTPALAAMFA